MPPPETPEELAARWVPGTGPVQVRSPAPGMVNTNYRVTRSGSDYSLRVSARHESLLGVDRGWECRVLACAAAAGLAPQVACCLPEEGILVTRWLSGRVWTAAEAVTPAAIEAMARLLRNVHALVMPQPLRSSDPGTWIDRYSRVLGELGRIGSRRAALDALRDGAHRRLAELASLPPVAPVLCHGDVHRHNVLEGNALRLLDWEFAHVTDPFWDLAGWAANNDAAPAFADDLLAAYLERRAEFHEVLRLRLLVWLYDYVCLLWSELYLSVLRPPAGAADAGAGSAAVAARAAELVSRLQSG